MHVVFIVDLCRQAEVGFVSGKSGKQSLFLCLWVLYVVLLQAGNGGRIGTSIELLAHPALPICSVSRRGFWCTVSGLTGEESDWKGWKGK